MNSTFNAPASAHLALVASAQMNKIHHLSTNSCFVVLDLMETLAEISEIASIGGNL